MASVKILPINQLKSKWHKNILADWLPDQGYIRHLQEAVEKGEYIAPAIVVCEGNVYYIVNGHHKVVAHLKMGLDKIRCIVIEGTFEDTESLRKAEVLLKEYDQRTGYRYQFSGYMDRWAAAVEKQDFINKYRPIYSFFPALRRKLHFMIRKILGKNPKE